MTDNHDTELDAALADLADLRSESTGNALARAKARLLAEIDQLERPRPAVIGLPGIPYRPRRRRWVWAASAAAVAVLAIDLAVLTNVLSANHSAEGGPAQLVHHTSGPNTTDQDPTPGPGQYRYVGNQTLVTVLVDKIVFQFTRRTQTWIPYDQTQNWVQDNESTVSRVLVGTMRQATAELASHQFSPPNGRFSAPCGDFEAAWTQDRPSCAHAGNFFEPTSAWLATLPRNPQQLLAYLTSGNVDPLYTIQRTSAVLCSEIVPADLRAAFYRALTLLPEIQIADSSADSSADFNGQPSIALGVADQQAGILQKIIIEPRTDQCIGSETTALRADTTGLPAGTTLDLSSITTGVVDAVGSVPTG